MKLHLDIRNFTKARINKPELEKVASKTLSVLGVRGVTSISLAIVGEGRIKTLNKKYRDVDRVTDVLAFGRDKARKNRFVEPPDKINRLGEVVVCLDQARIQAKFFGHSLEKELAILFIHGILHLLGWRDETKKEGEKMKKMEDEILKTWAL